MCRSTEGMYLLFLSHLSAQIAMPWLPRLPSFWLRNDVYSSKLLSLSGTTEQEKQRTRESARCPPRSFHTPIVPCPSIGHRQRSREAMAIPFGQSLTLSPQQRSTHSRPPPVCVRLTVNRIVVVGGGGGVQVRDYPGYNFIGLILGPRGNTQKRMEQVPL